MKDFLDSHTHTIASGHAYNTMNEMLAAARDCGLLLLGITDHAEGMAGTTPRYYFDNSVMIDREKLSQRFGVELLFGVELNILDCQGNVDMSDKLMRKMDVTVASIHVPCFVKGASRDEITEAYLNVMKKETVNIIGHPDDGRFPVDYRALAQGAKEFHVALEVNNHSLDGKGGRTNSRENAAEMLRYCKEYRVPVIMDSDAHVDTEVGNHADALALLSGMEFPEELVLNSDLELYKSFVNKYMLR